MSNLIFYLRYYVDSPETRRVILILITKETTIVKTPTLASIIHMS